MNAATKDEKQDKLNEIIREIYQIISTKEFTVDTLHSYLLGTTKRVRRLKTKTEFDEHALLRLCVGKQTYKHLCACAHILKQHKVNDNLATLTVKEFLKFPVKKLTMDVFKGMNEHHLKQLRKVIKTIG